MACRTNLSLVALFILLAISGQALAGRQIPKKSKDVDMKQPEFLLSDHSFLIPGIGRVLVPPHLHIPPSHNVPTYDPYTGIGSYIPGGDDTYVENPGVEVPNPGRVGTVPAATHP